jgi:hypothetical protein
MCPARPGRAGRAEIVYGSWAGPVRRRPAGQAARRARFGLRPRTGTARPVPAVNWPVTASELSTAAPIPAATADLIAVVEDSSASGGAGVSRAWLWTACSKKRQVPEAASQATSAVPAGSSALSTTPPRAGRRV